MYRLDVLLHILLNFVISEIFESAVVKSLVFFFRIFQHKTFSTEWLPCLSLAFYGLNFSLTIFIYTLKTSVVSVISQSFRRQSLLVIAIYIENVGYRVCTAHKIRVVCVNVGVLNLDK
jgi:hypothetical protein